MLMPFFYGLQYLKIPLASNPYMDLKNLFHYFSAYSVAKVIRNLW